ncbi:hypothetical protein [Streptomyces sp. GS7]|uniref:hypothetical protein n=1 Tax=Streptomyces sp. GS7 TaxID=2692234 RepID=UPI00131673E4|nr:hypothetical protein [Streptomyces sp. GS7]QHC20753.1 hypothetical protein GR130_04230 [Streptomyces sp. GS7]
MSDAVQISETPENSATFDAAEAFEAPPAEPEPANAPDPAEAIRAEIQREYAGRLAQAELRAEAAKAGVDFPDGFIDLLDLSKLLGEDGEPAAEAIALALKPFQAEPEPKFPQLMGMGHYNGIGARSSVSLDARNR